MDKTEFVKDFIEFNSEIQRTDSGLETGDITMLYAVYRKDIRANRLNNNNINSRADNQMATEKQKRYLMNLVKAKDAKLTEGDINKMTRQQASKAIDTLLEGV
jgi:hypothetical protein